MSWFDAGALANIAKSALKGAQKTIDKALDIKEEPHLDELESQGSVWGSFSGSFFVDQHQPSAIEKNDDFSENNSESVEICTTPESNSRQTTSDSVEILTIDTTEDSDVISRRHSQQLTDNEFISPLDSPIIINENFLSAENQKISPSSAELSVEIIPEEQEDCSVADDTMSYTSISETTVLDSALNKAAPSTSSTQKMLKDTYNNNNNGNNESTDAIITKAPSRSLLTLLDQKILLEKTNIIEPSTTSLLLSNDSCLTDDGSISDKTLVDVQIDSSDSASTATDEVSGGVASCNNSTYLKKMIADAMVEKSSLSPLSSEKSDLVKIGSDHTSCHTSCDELETTTSSDIEIISSPNGDSSSTQSRQSPIKKPKNDLLHKMAAKGHNRELSEASSVNSSDDSSDIERLLRRIAEMTEILESREAKLIETNRRNAELQEQNSDLRNQLDCMLTQQLESADLTQVTEEYTQRLSALEKKFQQALRDKDVLKKQLEQTSVDVATRLSKNEQDKDEIIRELRQEGDKLSRQQLQHGNIIKKLRLKEKDNEIVIKNLKETNENFSIEAERLKKSLAAKEEVERTQIEAVHNLTQKNKKLEADLLKTKSLCEDLTQKYIAAQKSLEAAKSELEQQTKNLHELQLSQNLVETLEIEKKTTQTQNEEVLSQLDDLRSCLAETEAASAQKAQKLKSENSDLLRRLEAAEQRNEQLNQTILDVSKPLVKQLDALQANHNTKLLEFEKTERELTLRIENLLSKNRALLSAERAAKEEGVELRAKMAELEGQLHRMEIEQVKLQQIDTERLIAQGDLRSKIDTLNASIREQTEAIEAKDKEIEELRQQLTLEKVNFEKQQQQQQQENLSIIERSSAASSPTLSLGKASIPESLSGSFWSQEEPFEATHAPRYTNMFEMQMLQSTLKQRDGELQQLQWELNRRERERSLLNSEISNLIGKIEELEISQKNYEKIKSELDELRKQYETLCQLFGEKVEETEELKLDLIDVKEMYKSQIDELLRQQKEAQ